MNARRYWMICLFACCLGLRSETWAGLANDDCLQCHSDKTLTMSNAVGKEVSIFVDAVALAASVHKTNACIACHADLKEGHPDDNLRAQPVNCGSCHGQAGREYASSIHGSSHTQGALAAATCANCHGHHAMVPVRNPASPVFKLNLAGTCARCHTDQAMAEKFHIKYPQVAAQYQDSIHGRALARGLVVAPSCGDCHGIHDIKRANVRPGKRGQDLRPVPPGGRADLRAKCAWPVVRQRADECAGMHHLPFRA
jgi:hypothetical protein